MIRLEGWSSLIQSMVASSIERSHDRARSRQRGVVAALLALTASCAPSDPAAPRSGPFRIGVLPDQEEAELRGRYEPLLVYLSNATGLEMELRVPADYGALLDEFDAGRIDLAWLGGLTFAQAELRSGALPLVSRDVDLEFTSDFLVSASSTARGLEDLEGAVLAFGPPLSTSGHLMPRYFLRELGIDVDLHFSEVRHSSGHDETTAWVRDGVVAVGAANSIIVERMFADGRLGQDDVRVVARTPTYQNYVWAVPPDLDRAVRDRILDAFLALDGSTAEGAAILHEWGARGFLPVSTANYEALREAARAAGMIEG